MTKRWSIMIAAGVLGVVAGVQGQAADETTADPPGETTAPAFAIGGEGTGFLPREIRRLHGLHAAGGTALQAIVLANLRTNERHDTTFTVRGGQCYQAIAAGMPSARELDLYVFDPFGQQRARDQGHDATPHTRFCPSVAGQWRVQLHMFNGYGRLALQVFLLPR